MNNLKSYTEYAVTSETTDFVIGFDFNYGTDAVNVTVDGVPATDAGYTVVYLNSTTMRLTPAVPTGVVRLQRETDIDVPDNRFTAGAKFIASNMDENFTQVRHAQQEVRDGFNKLSTDTYEIIDTLQDVGQAAQDAADAAEAAAQTANDAAAQVNDKVSYQDLDNAVEVAVAPVTDYVALPFKAGKSYALYERVQIGNGDIVKNTLGGNTVNPNLDMSGWENEWDDQRGKNSLTVDILEFIPKSEWQSILENTSDYDCTPALTQAIATGKKVTIGQSGTYKLITPYVGTIDFELEATASDVVLDGNDNIASYVITNSGSISKLTATFTNPSKHQMSMTLSDTSGLKTGEWLCFYCPTDYSYSQWRAYYRAGEWKQIRAIVGNIVWFTKPFIADYVGLTLDLYKLNSVKCAIKNVKLVRKNKLTGFVRFALSSNASDSDVQVDTEVLQAIMYDRCVCPISTSLIGSNLGTDNEANDYAVVFANCQHARVFKADVYARRHAVALGGGVDVCSVPVSDFRAYNSTLSADINAAVGAADMHGNIRDSSYEDCIIYGGTNIGGGEDCYYKRCIIHSDVKGVCGFGREIIGGSMGWIDCEYHSNGNPQLSGQAVISFGGNDSTTITEKTTLDVNLKVSGKVFGGAGYGAAVSFVKARNRGSIKKLNVVLDGIEFNNTATFAYLLNMDVVSGVANSDKIVVDNISGLMPSANLIYAPETLAGQRYLNKPMRLQKVVGVTTITTTAANFSTSPAVNYPFAYPRKPLTQVTARGVDGAAKNTYGGRRSVSFGVNSQANGAFVAVISSDTALTVGDVIELAYSSEIREC